MVFVLPGVHADTQAIKMQNQVSTQFMMELLRVLHKVSPEQEVSFKEYDQKMYELLKLAKKIDMKFNRSQRKGSSLSDKKALRKEGEILLEKALNETEVFLKGLSNGIHKHRKDIIESLLPESK